MTRVGGQKESEDGYKKRVGGQNSVAFHELRPEQIAARKRACPVAYLPLGILEWHGLHNPYGLDGLKAYGFATTLAEQLGGLAMPPMYWGDNRAEICERHLDRQMKQGDQEWNPGDTMCGALEVPRDSFARNAERAVRGGGWRLWEELVVHSLFEIESYGFKAIVAVPGHYPLIDPLNRAIARYAEEGGTCKAIVLMDALYSHTGKGDHAAAYETSMLLAIQPETVDLGRLDPDLNVPLAGVALGPDPRTDASQEYGDVALQRAVDDMRGKVAALLQEAQG